jgi:hypothetical protein
MATLASDSKCSQQNVAMLADHQKIFTPTGNEYWEIQGVKVLAFALAGEIDMLPWIKEELEIGVTHRTRLEDLPESDFVILAVTENGQAWYWGLSRSHRHQRNTVILSAITGPCAAGSGQTIATAVMSVGATAVDAVKQAIRLDNHSGGSVQTWVFPGVPEVMSTRPPKAEPEPVFTKTDLETAVADAIKSSLDQADEKPKTPLTAKELVLEAERLALAARDLMDQEAGLVIKKPKKA